MGFSGKGRVRNRLTYLYLSTLARSEVRIPKLTQAYESLPPSHLSSPSSSPPIPLRLPCDILAEWLLCPKKLQPTMAIPTISSHSLSHSYLSFAPRSTLTNELPILPLPLSPSPLFPCLNVETYTANVGAKGEVSVRSPAGQPGKHS